MAVLVQPRRASKVLEALRECGFMERCLTAV